ncbi:hypothetical protein GQ53DRAFT_673809, partial [Thozetella sp. PMI_491]
IGSIKLDILINWVMFYIVDVLTSFLFYLRDIDKLRVELYNMCNKLVSAFRVYVLVYRK